MDFQYSPDQETFRKEFRDWLAANLPPGLCLDDAADDRVASDRETFERRRAWQRTMHGAGWVGITWPKEYGGRGAGLIERVIWEETYAAARAPVLPRSLGHHHFNEVFSTDVAVPKTNLLGPLNQGWKVATTTLMHERHSAGGRGHAAQIARLVELARRVTLDGRPAWEHPWVRQRLAELAIECEALKYTRLRSLTRQLRGEPPGPEGSILKLTGSELGVRIAEVAGGLLGMHVLVNRPSDAVSDAPRWFNRVLAARQYTISAGTSEIQRNIIGERVLGLPKG